jgi:Fe-S-cluster containining protein
MNEDRWPSFKVSSESPSVQSLNALIRKAEILTEKALQSERSPRSLSEAIKQIYAIADADAQALTASINRIAETDASARIQCAKGCCHCCYRVPEVSFAELAYIWSLVQTFSEDSKRELRNRSKLYIEQTAPYRPNSLGQARAPCPFLQASECSIYEARPLSCRALNSRNVSVCETIRLGTASAQRPAWPEPVQHAMALRMGTRLGQFFEAMGYETLDLGHALAVLFENEDAIQQYLDGKDLFLSSHSAQECEPFESGQIARSNGPAFCSTRENEGLSGNLPDGDYSYLRDASNRYLESGNFGEYIQSLKGNSVNFAMARINVPRVAASEQEIDLSREAFMSSMREFEASAFSPDLAFNSLVFHQTMNLPYQGREDVGLLREHGRFIVENISRRALPQFASIEDRRRKPGKLRVGYISGHLNGSSNGRWAWPWVKHHSSEIETFCFLVGPTADAYTTLFRTYSDHFFWLKRSVPENAAFIRACDLPQFSALRGAAPKPRDCRRSTTIYLPSSWNPKTVIATIQKSSFAFRAVACCSIGRTWIPHQWTVPISGYRKQGLFSSWARRA